MQNPFLLIESRLDTLEQILIEIRANQAQPNQVELTSNQLLTVTEAAAHLRLAVPTLYGLVQRSKIPVCKRGKRLYFDEAELTTWIKEGRKKTAQEIDTEATAFLNSRKKVKTA